MKITVSKIELLGKLRILGKVLQSKNTLPIYDDFLFVVNKNSCVSVTAGEEGGRITTNIDCQTDCVNLQFTANAKTLLDALKEIPEQPLTMEISLTSDGVGLDCTYSNGKFSITGKLGMEYPEMPFVNPLAPVVLNSSEFLYGIRQVKICCANDMLRPVLNGVYFDRDIDKITYVASNGNILGLVENAAPHVKERSSFIIPSRYAQILSAIIPENCEEVKVTLASSNARFEFDNYCLTFRLIEGRYPNYRSVIPQTNDKEAIISKESFISATRRTAVFSNPNTLAIKLSFSDRLLIQGQDTDYSTSAEEVVNVETYKGKKIEIGFKSTYLVELLSNISSEKVRLSMKEPSTAVLLSPVDEENSLLYLLMPLSINF